MEKTYSIRQLVKEFAVTSRALRFYEDEGFFKPTRINAQTRIYTASDRERIILILKWRRLGFSLAEVREHIGVGSTAEHARSKMIDRIARFEVEQANIAVTIEALTVEVEKINATSGSVAGLAA